MKVAVTGAAGTLGRALLPQLAERQEVYACDLTGDPPDVVAGNVLDPEAMGRLCDGMDAVIHLAAAAWDDQRTASENSARILDTRLQGTYNVMEAARNKGVGRVIQISDVCILKGYAEQLIVSEDFAPLPDTSACQQSVFLSELIAREFSRVQPGLVLTLRLGKLVDVDSLAPCEPFDPAWLDINDAVGAIIRGLQIDTFDGMTHWGLYNLVGDTSGRRFSTSKTRNGRYGWCPSHDFHLRKETRR